MPFLVAPQNMKERLEIREMENRLIEQGAMKEEDRMVFENNSKMIALSSASYTFENLFKTYKEWMEKIQNKDHHDAKYFISQMSYEALPEEMVDPTIIEEAQTGGVSNSSFQREYCAQFTDGSDSYFSAKKMHECTIPDGEEPTLRLSSSDGAKYIIAIDPSFSNSPSSDYFAMTIMELNEENKTSTVVHSYAVAGGDLKDHIAYMHYLTDSFNVVMVIIDNAGYQFLDSCNENDKFKNKKLKFIDFNSDAEGADYEKMLRQAKRQYNNDLGHICFKQVFTTNFIRNANEYLQACIDHKKVWFGSRIAPNPDAFMRESNKRLSVIYPKGEGILDLIENQDNLIYQTKKQCALLEVTSTARGTQSFDLPQHLKRNTSANRARKDNYTTLMLGNWAVKCYFDMMDLGEINVNSTFSPLMIQ